MVVGSRGIPTPLATGGTWTVDVDTAVIGGDLEKAIGKKGGKGEAIIPRLTSVDKFSHLWSKGRLHIFYTSGTRQRVPDRCLR